MPGASNICRRSKSSARAKAVPGSSSWEGKAGNAGSPITASPTWCWRKNYKMGGQTTQTTQQSQQSQTDPWKPTQPYLQQTLQQLGPALGNTATSADESSALQELVRNAQNMPN